MASLRLFAQAREAAGTAHTELAGTTVAEILGAAAARYGSHFAAVVATATIWVNGEPAVPETEVVDSDEVAVLPPVSGG